MFFSSIMTTISAAYFRWQVNSTPLSSVYIGGPSNTYKSGSGMITVELAVGDTVSFNSDSGSVYIHPYTYYTLIKIK